MSNVILLLGRGVLAEAIRRETSNRWHVEQRSLRDGIDIADILTVRQLLLVTQPAVVINAAGCIDYDAPGVVMLRANSTGPTVLSAFAPCPIVHVSTDCVFKPANGVEHIDTCAPDPDRLSLYSVTKAAGEIPQRQLVVRTSFVGPGTRMWEHVRACVERDIDYPSWDTFWSGSHVEQVAYVIARKAVDDAMNGRMGVVHATIRQPVRKGNVARKIAQTIGGNLETYRTAGHEDRILAPTRGYEVESFV